MGKQQMRNQLIRSLLVTALSFGTCAAWIANVYAAEDNWEKISGMDWEKRTLDRTNATYDERTAKFYKRVNMKMKMNQALTMTVKSSRFVPRLIVRDQNGKIVHEGEFKRELDPNGHAVGVCELSFVPPENGTYLIDTTTGGSLESTFDEDTGAGLGEGEYWVQAAIWQEPESLDAIADFPEAYAEFRTNGEPFVGEKKGVNVKSVSYVKGTDYNIPIEIAWIEAANSAATYPPDYIPAADLSQAIEPIARQDGNIYTRNPTPRGYEGVLIIDETREIRAMFYVKPGDAAIKARFIDLAKAMMKDVEDRAIKKR